MNQGVYDLRRDVDRLKNKTDKLAKDYYIEVENPIITYQNETYTPSYVSASSYASNHDSTDFYDGYIVLWSSTDGFAEDKTYVGYTYGHTLTHTIDYTDITNYLFELYNDDWEFLDKQSVTIVRTTKGGTGKGYDFIYYTTSKTELNSQTDYPINGQSYTKLEGNYDEWLQRPKEVDATHSTIFMSLRTTDDNEEWGDWSTPVKYSGIGERGEDGEGLEMIFCRTEYADNYPLDPYTLAPVQTDDYVPNGWSDDQQGVNSTYCFEYVSMRRKEVPTGGKVAQWGKFSHPKLWASYGEDGQDGKGIEFIFRRNNSTTDAPTFQGSGDQRQDKKTYNGTVNGKHFYDDDYVPQNWTDDQTGVDENNQCEWVAMRVKKVTNGVASWESFNTPRLWATWSEDGDDSVNVSLGNEAQLIPVDSEGNLKGGEFTINIPIYCYKGLERVAGTININSIATTGNTTPFSAKSSVNPTSSNDGSVTLTCSRVPSRVTNNEEIKVTVGNKTYTKYFTWNKVGDGRDGNDGGTYDFVYYTTANTYPPSITTSTTIQNNPNRVLINSWCARPTNTTEQYPYCYGAYIKKVDGEITGNYSDVYLWSKYGVDGTSITGVSNYYASAIAYDNGTTSDHKDIWTSGASSMSRGAEYSTVFEPSDYNVVLSTQVPPTDCQIEFDVYQEDGLRSDFFYQFGQGGNYKNGASLFHLNKDVGEWVHVIIDIPSESGYHTLSDGSTTAQRSMTWDTTTNLTFNLWTAGDITKLRFKNFRVYSNINKVDKGTISNHGDIWTNGTSTMSRGAEYSTITEPSNYNVILATPIPAKNVRIEFDVYQEDGLRSDFFYQFGQGGNYKNGASLFHLNKDVGEWVHVIIDIPSESGYHTLSDGSTTAQRSMTWDTTTNLTFNLWTAGDIKTLRFKNFRWSSTDSVWNDDITKIPFDSTYKYVFNKEVTKSNNHIIDETIPHFIGEYQKGGQTIGSIVEEYALSTSNTTVTGSWSTTVPKLTPTNKYLWNREKITYANPTSTQTTAEKVIGVYGDKGNNGMGILTYKHDLTTYTTTVGGFTPHFRVSLSTLKPDAGVTTVQVGDFVKKDSDLYRIGYVDSTYAYLDVKEPLEGEDGADGIGIEQIFRRTAKYERPNFINPSNNVNEGVASFTGTVRNKRFSDDDFVPTIWTDNPQGVTDEYPYEWVSHRAKTPDSNGNGQWGDFDTPTLWSNYGFDGVQGLQGNKGDPGRDGTELTAEEIMMKISGQEIDAQTVGKIQPNEIVTTKLEDTGIHWDSANHGYYRIFKMGRLVIFSVNDYRVNITSTANNQQIFELPEWARPEMEKHYFPNIPSGEALSVTNGGLFRYSPSSTGTKQLAGTISYIASEGNRYAVTLTPLNTTITTGNDLTIQCNANSKILKNATIKFILNNQVYTRNTGNIGQVALKINLPSGTYPVTVEYGGNPTYQSKTYSFNLTVTAQTNTPTIGLESTNRIYVKIGSTPLPNLSCKIVINNNQTFYQSTDYNGILDVSSIMSNFTTGTYTAKVTTNDSGRCPNTTSGNITVNGTKRISRYTKTLSPTAVDGNLNSDYSEKDGHWWNYATTGSFANKNDGAYAITDIMYDGRTAGLLKVGFTPSLPSNASVKKVTVHTRYASLQGWVGESKGSYTATDTRIRIYKGNSETALAGIGEKNYVYQDISRTECNNWVEVGYEWSGLNISASDFTNPYVWIWGITNHGGGYGNNSRFGIDFLQMVVEYEV